MHTIHVVMESNWIMRRDQIISNWEFRGFAISRILSRDHEHLGLTNYLVLAP